MMLNPDEGGEGRWRGGKGIEVDYRVRADGNFMTVGYTRSRVPPWGLAGGKDGTSNYVEIVRANGKRERYSLASGVIVNKGDVIRIVTGNGGGYGEPSKRDRQAVLDDIDSGYLTPGRAAEVYGVSGESIG
jgi:N-methylhydantoinase B